MNKIPEGTVLFETFKKCLSCQTYNPAKENRCLACGLLFLREADKFELEELSRRYMKKHNIVEEE